MIALSYLDPFMNKAAFSLTHQLDLSGHLLQQHSGLTHGSGVKHLEVMGSISTGCRTSFTSLRGVYLISYLREVQHNLFILTNVFLPVQLEAKRA